MRRIRGLTVEQKMKAMREVQEIYALGKKWRRNLPDEKRPDFEGMADRIMSRALGLPTIEGPRGTREPIYEAAHMSLQDPRTAALVERTLKNGMYHPDVLHSFQSDRTTVHADAASDEREHGRAARPPPLCGNAGRYARAPLPPELGRARRGPLRAQRARARNFI